MIRYDRLEAQLGDLREKYASAKPFPHIAIDDFLEPAVAEMAFERFPSLASMDALKDYRQVKAQDPMVDKFDPVFQHIIFDHLHSDRFLTFISELTGIPKLHADSQLYAAGLAQGGDKSFLNVHIDNSSHPTQALYRRVNILVYLNRHWTEAKGGHFEVWGNQMESSDAILPAFNRAVIFTVSPTSWHGYRRVVTPDGDTRKSINIYYFTEESPTGADYHHITSFRARPGETFNKVLYPLDNAARSLYRVVRRRKDAHAVLYPDAGQGTETKKR